MAADEHIHPQLKEGGSHSRSSPEDPGVSGRLKSSQIYREGACVCRSIRFMPQDRYDGLFIHSGLTLLILPRGFLSLLMCWRLGSELFTALFYLSGRNNPVPKASADGFGSSTQLKASEQKWHSYPHNSLGNSRESPLDSQKEGGEAGWQPSSVPTAQHRTPLTASLH